MQSLIAESFDKRFSLDQIVQVLNTRLTRRILLNVFLYDLVQLSTVEELAGVGENVIRSIIKHLINEQLHHALQFGVGTEVLFVFKSQFELFFSISFFWARMMPSTPIRS